MAKTSSQEPTPDSIAALATDTVRLPRIALLGIFGSETAPMALVREHSGDVARVGVGDQMSLGTVAAIGMDQLVLRRPNGTTKTLHLPKG